MNLRSTRCIATALTVALGWTASACGGEGDSRRATPSAASAAEPSLSVIGRSLPIQPLLLSEDAPTDLKAALEQSDLVILGKIVEVRPGRRFYGVDPDDPNGVGTEDVTLVLAPERVIKGDAPGTVEFGWPAFATKDGKRIARLEVSQVLIDEPSQARSVWFLKDYGQPFGLVPISLGTAMMSVNGEGIIAGQRSEGFDRYDSLTVDELIDEATG